MSVCVTVSYLFCFSFIFIHCDGVMEADRRTGKQADMARKGRTRMMGYGGRETVCVFVCGGGGECPG